MDVLFSLGKDRFIWDSVKAASNVSKHGVNFLYACEIFLDPDFLLEDATVDDEKRWAAIGLTKDWKLMFVVHLLQEDEAVRIISARRATAIERQRYEDDE